VWGGALGAKRSGGGKAAKGALRAPRVVAYKREDGMLAGMIMVDDPEAGWAPGAVKAALSEHHPSMPAAWVDRIEAQVAARPPSSFGRIISVSRLDGPRAVLVGDAAHAITSSLGQGCNTGVDSAAALAAALERVGGDLDKLPAAYSKARLPDVRAMQRLELMSVLATPGSGNGNFLQRLLARFMLVSATVLGLMFARKPKPQKQGSGSGGAGAGGKMHSLHVRASPPWMTQLRDHNYSPRDVLRGVRGYALLAAVLVAAFAAVVAKGLYALLAIAVGA
jgi:2-polyprenyl-6-methoxyphenol hydroxylase-like FAD-dependent oxidoreductase